MPAAEAAQLVSVSEQKCSVSGVFDRISFYFIYITICMDADGHCQNLVQLLAAHRTEFLFCFLSVFV